jgi:nitrite reductase/ring-hydroxylating ferredoxin subunit
MMKNDAEPKVRQLPGDFIQVEIGGKKFLATAACPHRKGRLVFGYVNTRKSRITCPLHHSTFDLDTGCVISGPADSPLPVKVLIGGALCSVVDNAKGSTRDEDISHQGI